MTSLPVLTFHSIAPAERLNAERLAAILSGANRRGRAVGSADLDGTTFGFLVTFDDGFADLWTHGIKVLERLRIPAVVFVIPSRAG
ncbi:MAG: hypothetical protein D6708_10630, partial [Candidatus Dadabacteria bacterium]